MAKKLNVLPGKALIGMVHVGALPTSPGGRLRVGELARRAAAEAVVLARAGFDAVMIENMHDAPYVHGVQDPAVVAAMTACGLAVQARLEGERKGARRLPLGLQILSGGNREALAVALAIGAGFIRAENFVFAHVADEGLLERAEAGPLLRYRRMIGAEGVMVFTDIKKKHASHALTADLSLGEAAEAAGFFGSDGLVVTGRATGKATDLADVAEAREATRESGHRLPVLVGSGVGPGTVAATLAVADGAIVGSSIKRDGRWSSPVDARRAAKVVAARG